MNLLTMEFTDAMWNSIPAILVSILTFFGLLFTTIWASRATEKARVQDRLDRAAEREQDRLDRAEEGMARVATILDAVEDNTALNKQALDAASQNNP